MNKPQVKRTLLSILLALMMMPVFGIVDIRAKSAAHAAEGSGGNGGGSWVCRNPDASIRWAVLVDLFEAQNQHSLTLAEYPGSVREIVDQVQLRMFRVDKDFYNAVAPYIEELGYLESNPPNITYTEDKIKFIDDALYDLLPAAKRCPGGILATDADGTQHVPYEQMVNFKTNKDIMVQSEIFNALSSNTHRAATVVHEALYAYRRSLGDKDSVMSRRMVGLFFSTLSTDELKKELQKLEVTFPGDTVLGMEFQPITAGSFMMGSPKNESGRWDDEKQHYVTITHNFWMQKTDVTQYQWFQAMGDNPSYFSKPEYCPNDYKFQNGVGMCPNNPVEQVSWYDVQNFIGKMNTRNDGHFYRLPTEAEWEYAARAGTSSTYSFGNDSGYLYQYGWFDGNSGNQTHPVATKEKNGFGLYDMQGNVWQWVSDWYAAYGDGPAQDPAGGYNGSRRVVRGGGWNYSAQVLRSATRDSFVPSYRYHFVGFRLARTTH